MLAEPTFGFPRVARLLAKIEFDAVFGDGRGFGSRYFRISYRAASPDPAPAARLGLAVSRRASKRAVQRNRIKRCVRESFRHVRSTLPALDIVVGAKADAALAPSAALRQDLQQLWLRLAGLKAKDADGTMRGAR